MNKKESIFEFLVKLQKVQWLVSRKLQSNSLGFTDLLILHTIMKSPDEKIRRGELGEQVGLTASGITRLLLPLEKLGIIKRESHERDSRVSYVSITKSGKEMYSDAMLWVEQKCEDMLPDTSSKDIALGTQLLERMGK